MQIVFAKRKIIEGIISVILNYNKRVLKMGWVIYCSAVDIASISSKSMKRRSMMIFIFPNDTWDQHNTRFKNIPVKKTSRENITHCTIKKNTLFQYSNLFWYFTINGSEEPGFKVSSSSTCKSSAISISKHLEKD